MKKRSIGYAFSILAAFHALPAFADYRCATESKGVEYSQSSPDQNYSSQSTVSICKQAPTSDNNECANNVVCDNGYQNGNLVCYTESKGIEFNAQSEFDSLASSEVIGQCRSNAATDNNECSNNVQCADQSQDPAVLSGQGYTCTAQSRGLPFARSSLFQSLAQAEAISDCTKSPSTDNNECMNSVYCQANGAPAPAPVAVAPQVRITSINGEYDPNHAAEIYVHPGDMITLSSDLLDAGNGFAALGDSVEDFVWSANDTGTDQCDVAANGDCLQTSSFQATDYGVTYYVPYNIGEYVQISVTSHNPNAVDANGYAQQDTIILRNQSYTAAVQYVAPTVVVSEPTQYPYDHLDADYALAGHGHWVWISGVRYFVPNTYVVGDEQEWMPYRHGYWNWDGQYGWTWTSFDPWGWMTDHYGVWRYHGSYGWVWLPFDDLHYEPHCVTWFDDGGYVGWYPYHDAWRDAYRHGLNEGFTDGYWEGYGLHSHWSEAHYNPGYTLVARENVTHGNIIEVAVNRRSINDPTLAIVIGHVSYGNGFAQHPGGSREGSLTFIENRASAPAPRVSARMVTTAGRASFMMPPAARPVPQVYHQVAGTNLEHRVPVGTVARGSLSHPEQGTHFTPPSTNGRGIVAAPHVVDASGNVTVVPAHTMTPARPHPGNPVTNEKPVQPPHPAITPSFPHLPVLDPRRPTPPPVSARPSPARPAPVEPSRPAPVAPPAPRPPRPAPRPIPPVTPAPAKPVPAPVSPAPAPVTPTPGRVTPGSGHSNPPGRPPVAPIPAKPVPAPAKPVPAPAKPAPAPAKPVPAPAKPVPAPAKPAPAPVTPAPTPAKPAPAHTSPPGTPPGHHHATAAGN